ncbi:MAG: transposase, partial [Fusobacterium mortiferum]|nr:transposase [Fusobacterium mortiferum]
MSILPKETIREIIKSQNFKSANDIHSFLANDIHSFLANDIHSFLKDIIKDFIQESLEIELDSQLGYEKNDKNFISDNSRNGYSKKKVKSSLGEIELDIPCDRNAEFEPHIVPKYSRDISNLEEKIISMYGLGMVTRDISKHINEIY